MNPTKFLITQPYFGVYEGSSYKKLGVSTVNFNKKYYEFITVP